MVKKNYTIARLAQSLYEMSEVAKRRNCRSTERVLNDSVSTVYGRYPIMEDKDIKFILDIVEDYQRGLKDLNRNYRNAE